MIQYGQNRIDDMTKGLYRAGEVCFRHGEFEKALEYFERCAKTPKNQTAKLFEAKSNCIIGMIYSYWGQEQLAKERLLQALYISRANGYERELLECYLSLSFFHYRLRDDAQALEYLEKVLPLIADFKEKEPDTAQNMELVCLAYQGLIYAKADDFEMAEEILHRIAQKSLNTDKKSCRIPILDLKLRVAYEKQDMKKFMHCFKELLVWADFEEGYFETLEYYFDLCTFFLEKDCRKEARALLDCIRDAYRRISLAYLKYHICNYELQYAKKYEKEEKQWQAAQELLEVIPEYEEEQQKARLYSFSYIEFIHEEQELSAKMEQKSKMDPMTGLFNKFTIEFLVDEYFGQKKAETVAALLILDMDHFKQINDTLGHLTGDAILTDAAAVILRFFNENALCGRVGGDEFMVFVKEVPDVSSLLLQTEFLRQEIAKITSERNISIPIQASVGIALTTAGFRDYTSMFHAADEALYRAKKEGRNRISVIE